MRYRLFAVLWGAGTLALTSCNRPPDNSGQIQAINDKIQDLDKREQELQLQAERDKLDADRAALNAERQQLDAQKSATPAALAVAVQSTPIPHSNPVPPPGRVRRVAFNEDTDEPSVAQPEDAAPSDASYDVFYDRLQNDGQWLNDDTYGYVWQPEVAAQNEDWRPYSDGHWAYTDRGWTWISNERFGWATYHYGRWVRLRGRGWIWIPGRQWAPAWVSWRQSNNDDYVGWAPLPPECDPEPNVRVQGWVDRYYDIGPLAYVFLRMADMGRPSYRQVIVPQQENVTIIDRTKNITNVYYNNQVVNNFGPQYEQVSQRVSQPINRYQINYVTANQSTTNFQTVTSGNQIQVTAPPAQLRPQATLAPKGLQTIQNAPVERGWQNVPAAQTQQLRQSLAQSAPPVPKTLPARPVPPPKPIVAAAAALPPAPNRSAPAKGAVSPVPSPDVATERARLEAEKARLLQQKQALQGGTPPPPSAQASPKVAAGSPAKATGPTPGGKPVPGTPIPGIPVTGGGSKAPAVTAQPPPAATPAAGAEAQRAEAAQRQAEAQRQVQPQDQQKAQQQAAAQAQQKAAAEAQQKAQQQAASEAQQKTQQAAAADARQREAQAQQQAAAQAQQKAAAEAQQKAQQTAAETRQKEADAQRQAQQQAQQKAQQTAAAETRQKEAQAQQQQAQQAAAQARQKAAAEAQQKAQQAAAETRQKEAQAQQQQAQKEQQLRAQQEAAQRQAAQERQQQAQAEKNQQAKAQQAAAQQPAHAQPGQQNAQAEHEKAAAEKRAKEQPSPQH